MNQAGLLHTRDLGLRLGGRQLLAGLNWEVQSGQLWCLLGRNGAGKTTLLQTAAGLRQPSAGTAAIAGHELGRADAARLARLRSYLPQERVDAFAWPVLDTVLLGRTPWRVGAQWDSEDEKALALAALRQVEMEEFAARNVQALSGGERQRVALAALLVQDTPLMLLDEPLSHQDVAQQVKLMQLLRTLLTRHAVVMSCHDINLAARFATHVLLLGEGQHWIGPAATVLNAEDLEAAYGCSFQCLGGLFVPQALGPSARD